MKALALDFESRSLEWSDIDEPGVLRMNDVLIRIHETGVCGTDRALAKFKLGRPPTDKTRLVLGHEALAEVIETGSGVTKFHRGDWVVPTVRRACSPPCSSCARGRRDLCVTGRYTERGILGLDGYFTSSAVDAEDDLVAVPHNLLDIAVLIEPLTAVEKAIARALAVHQGDPRTALVLGLGPIGMLTALALRVREFRVRIHSLEPEDHPRATMMREQGIEYSSQLDGFGGDIIIEASGSNEAALAALTKMPPLGVMIVLGAPDGVGPVPLLRMIVNNQTVIGSVNADDAAFRASVEDLGRFDRRMLHSFISRAPFSALKESLAGSPTTTPKVVHVVD